MCRSLSEFKDKLLSNLPEALQVSYIRWRNKDHFDAVRNRESKWSPAVFDEHKMIFIHIPKTGGVSVAHAVFECHGGGHITARDYKLIFGPITYRRYFKFCFVRNPYSRSVSAFKFMQQGTFGHYNDRKWKTLLEQYTYKTFVLEWLNKDRLNTNPVFQPQINFLSGDKSNVDFVGRFERLSSDFDRLCSEADVEASLPHYNRSTSKKDWRMYYTDEAVQQKIFSLYQCDFSAFDYSKAIDW